MALRILVADDSTTIQKVIKIAFAQYDAHVATSSSHVELLRELAQNRPDAMIVDALLPGMKGPDSFRKLADEWGVPILILVGSYESVEEAPFRSVGFNHILRKPFGSTDVVEAVGAALGREIPLAGAGGTPATSAPATPVAPASGIPGLPPPPVFNLAKTPPPPPPPPVAAGGPFAMSLSDADTDGIGRAAVPPPPPPAPPAASAAGPVVPAFEINLATPPPSAPLADESRRGRRAFDDDTAPPPPPRFKPAMPPPPPPPVAPVGRSTDLVSELTDAVLKDVQSNAYVPPPPPSFGGAAVLTPPAPRPAVAPTPATPSMDELRGMVREAVEEYCSKHFPAVAREVIVAEIRRLTEERARQLAE